MTDFNDELIARVREAAQVKYNGLTVGAPDEFYTALDTLARRLEELKEDRVTLAMALQSMVDVSPQSYDWYQARARQALRSQEEEEQSRGSGQ